MARPAIGIMVLGLGIVFGVCLFVGGCMLMKNWYPFFVLVPAAVGLLCQWGIVSTSADDAVPGLITADAWVFFLVICLTSILGLPVVLWHVGDALSAGALACSLAGSLVMLAGFVGFHCLSKGDSTDWTAA
jgi:hypothetical protein